uniref:Uncharacterized protein n=1 Tax=Onchocerca volvulus TaxID=6282 RepID=A0A8R1TUW7_ONCVO
MLADLPILLLYPSDQLHEYHPSQDHIDQLYVDSGHHKISSHNMKNQRNFQYIAGFCPNKMK